MNRLGWIILKNFWCIPGLLVKLNMCAKYLGKYTSKDRMELIRYICKKPQKSGDISVEVSGTENISPDGGFIFYPNHQGIFDGFAITEAIKIPFSSVIKKN